MQEVVRIDKLSYSYETVLSLDNVSFSVDEGDFLGIIGPNGAGKTTLFHCMVGIINGYQGQVSLFGQDIQKNKKLLQKIGYVPQSKFIDQGFPATIEEIVSLGAIGKKLSSKIETAIKTVGLFVEKNRRIGDLSAGQQQRVIVAKALVNDPSLLILDEPTTGIDTETQNKFYALLTELNKERKITIIWSSHDMNAVEKFANKVACIDKKMFFHGDAIDFFSNQSLRESYIESAMQSHMNFHFGNRYETDPP
jgi:zinc transport system ATP-binding protein